MYKSILFLSMCSAFASGSKLSKPAGAPAKDRERILGCYYNCRHIHNNLTKVLLMDQIDVTICTHLFYDCVGLRENATFFCDNDHANLGSETFKQLRELRKNNQKLKTLVTVTGLYDLNMEMINNRAFTDMNLQGKLVNNLIKFVEKYGFNGLDLGYSDPQSGGQPSDKKNFVSLLKALRERFNEKNLILSVGVNPVENTAKILYDIEAISKYVNFINLKTFDFNGRSNQEKKFGIGNITPMYPSLEDNPEERKINIDYVVKYWISQGAPRKKLILGIPFHGISFAFPNPNEIDPVGSQYAEEDKNGLPLQYHDICPLEKDHKWKHIYDKEQQVTYIYCTGNLSIAYDNVHTIEMKAEYVKKMHLGGAMAFSIDEDDFAGTCGEKFPLLKTLNRALKN